MGDCVSRDIWDQSVSFGLFFYADDMNLFLPVRGFRKLFESSEQFE
jgi:hypothetical protein